MPLDFHWAIDTCRAAMVLVLVDACRKSLDGPQVKGDERGAWSKVVPRGTSGPGGYGVFYSCGPNQLSHYTWNAESKQGYSFFARAIERGADGRGEAGQDGCRSGGAPAGVGG